MPINHNIPSERCHNTFIFCYEVVREDSTGSFGLPVLPPRVFLFDLSRQAAIAKETIMETVSQCLVSVYVVSFCDHCVDASQS